MKITRFEVSGYRSLKHVVWEPGDLNIVIGPNGSGKSNLIQALQFLAETSKGNFLDTVYQNGGYQSLVWDGADMQIGFAVAAHARTSSGFDWMYRFDYNIQFDQTFESGGILREDIYFFPQGSRSTTIERVREEVRFRVAGEVASTVSSIAKNDSVLHGLPERFNHQMQQDLMLPQYFSDLYVGRKSSLRLPPVARYVKRLNDDISNLVNVLHTIYQEREIQRRIDDAMRAAFGSDYEGLIFPPAADQRVQMRIRWKTLKRETSAADISDGTFRFLFLLAVLCSPEPAPLIAIDEPETGLHPSMFPIIAEYAAKASKKSQIIFTTHSDQFLDAFRTVRPTITVAKWEDGETKLSIVDDEMLAEFLQEYSLGSLFRSGELESEIMARPAASESHDADAA